MAINEADSGGYTLVTNRRGKKDGKSTDDQGLHNANEKQPNETNTNTGARTKATTGSNNLIGTIQVRFMTAVGKNINIARALKEFIDAARQADAEFRIMPLDGEGTVICGAREVPNDKESIDKYYKHTVKPNNVCGTMRVHMSKKLNEIKSPKYDFRTYLREKEVYINLAQLGEVEAVTVGWIFRGHPAFTDRESIKENLKILMGEEEEQVQYAVFPKNIRYKRATDGAKLNTHAIAIQIPKSDDIDANQFRTKLAKAWKNATPITGGSLHGKMFIPLGRESNIQDGCMNNVVKLQNEYITQTRQRIVHNLTNIDRVTELDVEMPDGPEFHNVTIRDKLSQLIDTDGKKLFTGFEKTQTAGTYRFLFHHKNAKLADEAIDNIENTLNLMGDWEAANTHFRLDEEKEITSVGRVTVVNTEPFWSDYFVDFAPLGIPAEIDMKNLRHNNKRKKWATASYSDIARGAPLNPVDLTSTIGTTENEATIPSSTIASSAGNSALKLLQQKMDQIDQEREKFVVEQTRLSEELTTASSSLLKLSVQIVDVRKDMQNLGTELKGNMLDITKEMKEIKQMFLEYLKKDNNLPSEGTPSPRKSKRNKATTDREDHKDYDEDMEHEDQNMDNNGDNSTKSSLRGFQPGNSY